MLVLALDSATSACSVALWRDGRVLAHRFAVMTRGQSERLVPMVAEAVAEAGIDLADIDLLAVTVGPGAFTGIRIGLATARGLALALAKPLAGVSTTEAVAAGLADDGRVRLVVMDSRRDELWVQAFAPDGAALGPIEALTAAQVAERFAGRPVALAGDGAALALPGLPGAVAIPGPGAADAIHVAALASRHWGNGTALAPEPLYLRPADVTLAACPST